MRYVSTWRPSGARLTPRCGIFTLSVGILVAWGTCDILSAQPKGAPPGPPGGHGGGAGSKKAAPPPKKAAPPPVATAPVPVDSQTGIPLGFEPKKEVPELMLLDQQLVSDDTLAKWAKDLSKYRTALRNGELTPAAKALITNGIKFRIATMTVKKNQQVLHEKREDLTVRDMRDAGIQLQKIDQLKTFCAWVNDEIIKETEPLLQNNFYVRVHAATLLGELFLVPADEQKKWKFETYIPAVEPLRKVLRDAEQPTAVKIAAARSMIRLIRYGDMPANKRFETAKDVLAEVAKTDHHFWYQMRLVELLSTIDAPLDLETRKPTVVNELTGILRDPKRHWHVRAEAARALGRVALDPQVNISSLLQDLVQFASEMSKAAQQQPKAPQWEMCFFKLYLAFQSIDASEKDATKKLRAGLLYNPAASSAAKPAYDLILPVVNAVINEQAITAPQVQAMDDWLSKSRPTASAKSSEVKPPSQGASNGPAASFAGEK